MIDEAADVAGNVPVSGAASFGSGWSEQQELLRRVLAERDVQAETIYVGALMVLNDGTNPDRLAMAAHGIRELIEKLPKYFNLPMAERERMGDKIAPVRAAWSEVRPQLDKEKPLPSALWDKLEAFFAWCETELSTFRQKTTEMLRRLDPAGGVLPQPIEDEQVRQWVHCKNFFVEAAHHHGCTEDDLRTWLDTFERAVLDRVRPRTFERADELDAADADYFFDRLTSPDWIGPLKDAGMFQSPPGPRRDGGYVQFDSWPQSRYLARMASEAPQEVAAVIDALPPTENMRVLVDMADAVVAMPPEIVISLLPKIIAWLSSPYLLLLPDRLGKLIGKLAAADQPEPALALTAALLRLEPGLAPSVEGADVVLPPDPRPLFEPYEYQRILTANLPDLMSAGGVKTLDLLCDLLADAIRLSRINDQDAGSDDLSYIWRAAVEPSNQNHHNDVKDTLVDAVRDAAEQLVKADPGQLEPIVGRLEARTSVCRRISLHLLRLFAPSGSQLVADRLLDTELLYGITCYHEYWHLLHARFSGLSADQQNTLLGHIAAGPAFYREKTEEEMSEADVRLRIEAWQWRVLAAVKDDLPVDWAERYRQLAVPRGEPEHPDFLSYIGSMWSGPTSPTSAPQLEGMVTDEIVEMLRTWQPSGDWRSPTPEGLGRDLSAAVRAQPNRFAIDANKFRGLDPTYVRSLFSGLREAVANKTPIEWPSVLELAAWALDQPRNLPGREDRFGDVDPGWGWTRKTIADLLGIGFGGGPAQIPYDLREAVWSVLEPLTEDEEPTPDYEERYGGSNMDPMTLAINTVRGEAIDAVVHYALWVHRHIEQASDAAERLAHGFDEMPEVRAVLDRHLDRQNDPALAVRAMYGRWFPWLLLIDLRWATDNLAAIFPPDAADQHYWEAAWEAYISFCHAHDEPFAVLQEEYRRAISRLGQLEPERRQPHGVASRLADHLMTMYWRGKIDFEPGGLLDAFYAQADDELRGWAVASIGRGLQTIDQAGGPPTPTTVETEVVERLKGLWARRLAAAEGATDQRQHAKEMSEFGWWFTSQVFDESWAIDQLVAALRLSGRVDPSHLVLGRLAKTAEGHPRQTIDALRLMIRGDLEGWTVVGWHDELTNVLQTVLASGDQEVRNAAVDLVHELGAGGIGSIAPC